MNQLRNVTDLTPDVAWRIPLLNSATTGLLAAIPVAGIGVALGVSTVAISGAAAATGGLATLYVWQQFLQRVWWLYEAAAGVDIDGDGVVGIPDDEQPGEPLPRPESKQREIPVKVNGQQVGTVTLSDDADAVDTDDFEWKQSVRSLLVAIRQTHTTAQNKVEPLIRPFGGYSARKTYVLVRDWLIENGWARWKGKHPRAGWEVTNYRMVWQYVGS